MRAYKAFEPGIVATRGAGRYQYSIGTNVTEKAHCTRDGFHCAENPLDCLNYYSWDGKNEFWIVEAAGDIDEDGGDSKISCTELTLVRRMDLKRFVLEALLYMLRHPEREVNSRVHRNEGRASNGWCIVRGKNPRAAGEKTGDVLLYVIEDEKGDIVDYRRETVDGEWMKPNKFYGYRELNDMEQGGTQK